MSSNYFKNKHVEHAIESWSDKMMIQSDRRMFIVNEYKYRLYSIAMGATLDYTSVASGTVTALPLDQHGIIMFCIHK